MAKLLERRRRGDFTAEPSNDKKLYAETSKIASEFKKPNLGRDVIANVSYSTPSALPLQEYGRFSRRIAAENDAIEFACAEEQDALDHKREDVLKNIREMLLKHDDAESFFRDFRRLYEAWCADSLESGFLKHAQRLDAGGQTDAALDIVYDQIDEMLLAGKYEEVDSILVNTLPGDLSVHLILALLTTTLPAKQHLEQRVNFFTRAEQSLRDRGILRDGLLVGLE